jgi:hypothetical protein
VVNGAHPVKSARRKDSVSTVPFEPSLGASSQGQRAKSNSMLYP